MGVVANLTVKVTASTSDFDKQMAGLEKTLARTGSKVQSIGRDLTAGLTVPLVAIGGGAAKAAMDFEDAFSGVAKTVDGIANKNGSLTAFGEGLKQQFRDLSKTIPVTVNELAKIGETAGAMGIPKDKVLAFSEVMAKLGATTNVTSEQAAASIGKIQNVYQAAGVETDRFAASLVALGNAGASTEGQILDFAERMGGAAVQVGISQAEVLGWANAMASVGLNAELGSTAWNKVVSSIGKAVDLGGEKLTLFAKTAGMSSAAFSGLFKSDSSEAVNRLVEGFGRVTASGGNLTKVMEDMGFKTSGIQMTFKNLAAGGGQLRDSLEMGKKAWQDNVAMEEEFTKKAATTVSQLKILYNQLYDVAVTLGDQLLESFKRMVPALETAVGGLAGMVNWFSQLPEPVQTATFVVGGLAAALGPVAWALGQIMSTGSSVISFFRMLSGITMPSWAVAAMTGTGAALGGVGAFIAATYNDRDVSGGLVWAGAMSDDISGMGGDPNAPNSQAAKHGDIDLAKQWDANIGATTNLTSRLGALSAAATSTRASIGRTGLGAGLDEMHASAKRAKESVQELQFALADRSTETFYATVAQDMLRQGVGKEKPAELFSDQTNALGALPMNNLKAWAGADLGLNRGNMGLDGTGKSLTDLMGVTGQSLGEKVKTGMTSAMANLGPTIMSALQGGGNVGASIGALFGGSVTEGLAKNLTGSLSGMFGKTIGGALGSVIPGLGTMLGSMIGPLIANVGKKLWNGIQGVFGTDEEARDVNPARDARLAEFGDVSNKGVGGAAHNLASKLTEITGEAGGGALFAALQQADTMSEFNSAWSAIQTKLAESKTAATEAISATDVAADGFNLTIQGTDEGLARLGATQERITATMLVGFDNLIAKLSEFMTMLTGAASGMGGLELAVAGGVGLDGGVPIPSTDAGINDGTMWPDYKTGGAGEGYLANDMDYRYADGSPVQFDHSDAPESVDTSYRDRARPNITINGQFFGSPEAVAGAVLDAIEGGGEAGGKFRILTNQAVE